jgi:hypothetical protein
MKRLLILVALLGLAGCVAPLQCYGPSDCHGNACCYVIPTEGGGTPGVFCTSSPTSCAVGDTIDAKSRRMCETDADCVAGPISTRYTKCCAASVVNQGAHTCTSPELCHI